MVLAEGLTMPTERNASASVASTPSRLTSPRRPPARPRSPVPRSILRPAHTLLTLATILLIFPAFALALTPISYKLTLSDADTALTYSPGTTSPLLSDASTTWVDHRGRRTSNVKPPSPGDFVWGPDESEHATSLAGANVSVSFAGTGVAWYGHVSEGTTLSVRLSGVNTEGEGVEVKPRPTDATWPEPPAQLLASAQASFGALTASLALVSGSVNISSVVLTLDVAAPSAQSLAWVNQSTVVDGALNPFFTAPEWDPKPRLASISTSQAYPCHITLALTPDYTNIQGLSNGPPQWLNMTVPANTTLLVVNGASDPRKTTFDHFLSPGGKLPPVDVHRSWANPVVQTIVSLDPTVQYEYSILPTLAEPLKIGGISFLTVCGADCPIVPSEGVSIVGAGGVVDSDSGSTGSGPTTGSDTPGTLNAPLGKNKTNAGAIAGGVVGGVVALALLALLAILIRRRRARSKAIDTYNDDKIDLVDMPASFESGRMSGGRAHEHRVTPYEHQAGAGWSQPDSQHSAQSTRVPSPTYPPSSAVYTPRDNDYTTSPPAQSLGIDTRAPTLAPVNANALATQSPLEAEYKRSLAPRQLSIPGEHPGHPEHPDPNRLAPSGGLEHKRTLLALAPLSPGVRDEPHSFAGRLNTAAPASPVSPLAGASSSSSTSPRSPASPHEITVHADDAGPVHVNVLPPMYNPDWNGRG